MSRRNYSNTAAQTFIIGSITDTDTSLVVYNVTGYPNAPFTIRCESEVILVGAKSGTTFSQLSRGYDGTTAATHASLAVVEHRAIANDFSYRWLDRVTDKTATNTYTDHFDNDSLDAAWLQVTPTGTAIWTESRDVLSVKFDDNAGSDCCALVKSMGALSYPVVITTAIRWLGLPNYVMAGPVFTNGTATTSNAVWAMPFFDTNWGFNTSARTGTLTNISTNLTTDRRIAFIGGWLYVRLIWRATNVWNYEVSPDGVSYTDFAEGNESFSMTPTHFGLGVSTWGGTLPAVASFEYFDVSTSLP